MKDDPIATVLDDLMKSNDILACMVARRSMISVMPSDGTNSFKPEINEIWDIIKRTMDGVFLVISEFSQIGLENINFKLQDYEALFYIQPDTENALVAIIPTLANKGLLDVELEKARQKIQKIREEDEIKKVHA